MKSEQFLSSDMADVFSNIYLSYALLFCHKNDNISKKLTDYCLDRLYYENQLKINKIVDNFTGKFLFARVLLSHLKGNVKAPSYDSDREIIKELESNKKIMEKIKEDIHIKDNILEDLMKLTEYQKILENNIDANVKMSSEEIKKIEDINTEYSVKYDELYNKVIQVGEFENTPEEKFENWEKFEMNQKGKILERVRHIKKA